MTTSQPHPQNDKTTKPLARPLDAESTERPRILLIDLDNCPKQIKLLPDHLANYSRVLIFSAGRGVPKITWSLLVAIAPAIEEGKLELVDVPAGKNAADFTLTFYAGMLAVQMPQETQFVIYSNDKHLNCAAYLLGNLGYETQKINPTEGDNP